MAEAVLLLFLLLFLFFPVSPISCYHVEHASGIVIQELVIVDCLGLCFSGYLQIAEQDHYAGGCAADGMDCEAIGEARITYGVLGRLQGECCDLDLCNASKATFFGISMLLCIVFHLYK